MFLLDIYMLIYRQTSVNLYFLGKFLVV